MNTIKCTGIIKFMLLFCMFLPLAGIAQEWKLVWSDEFDGNGKPDESSWTYEQGFVRNREFQWYQKDNATIKDGILVIEARKESFPNPNYREGSTDWKTNRPDVNYTSASIKTIGKREFLYGRFEVKARIPVGKSSWPAIWMLGKTMPWPSNGEIDIMEFYRINGVPHILANTAWGTDQPSVGKWNTKTVPLSHFTDKDPAWTSKFHVWRMDWDETAIRLYLDDELLNETLLSETINGSIGNGTNPFKQPHYILLNLALGQSGDEPDDAIMPMKYEIDYVRVYQKDSQIKSPPKILNSFRPGQIWPDTDGNHINAHGGGILFYNNKYYWFGEHKSENTSSALVGVTCYSSSDLYNWKYEGVALPIVKDNPNHDITEGCVLERPKVIYNAATKKFVMYFHLELKGQGYSAARTGIAVADKATGPYTFIKSYRPNPGVWPINMTDEDRAATAGLAELPRSGMPEWQRAAIAGMYTRRDFESGQMSRDMTLFVDDDGKAYHIFAAEENYTLNLAELSPDYLSHTGKYIRIAPTGHNEAPAIFKKNGIYYMITSGCTGWDPNAARMFTASSIWGPWIQHPNPCVGPDADLTFHSQSTYILPVQGKKNAFIFMADRWTPRKPIDARYIWLPIRFEAGLPVLKWDSEWDLSVFDDIEEPNPSLINRGWKFFMGDLRSVERARVTSGNAWKDVDLPHDWSVTLPMSPYLASATGYLPGGTGWYRKNIFIDGTKQGMKAFLYFEGIYNRSQVYVNGKLVGGRPSGYASFEVDITPAVVYGTVNEIAVRVDHSKYIDSRWYTGSGIYRDVWLKYTDPVRIAQWGVFAYGKDVSAKKATLVVETEIESDVKGNAPAISVRQELFSPSGKLVAKGEAKVSTVDGNKLKAYTELKLVNPELWDIENPALYTLETTLIKDKKIIERSRTRTGFRSLAFDPNKGFELNGKNIKVKGVCIHHDAGVLGAAVTKEVWERRLITLKSLGCNAIRCSHNPHAPYLYDLCDEIGLLVMDEAFDEWEYPKRKWIEGWNVGTPGLDGITDFFPEWGDRDVADMVRRDRNYVSIFTWSIGNEIDYPNDPYSHPVLNGRPGSDGFSQPIYGGFKEDAPNAERLGDIAERLVAIVKKYDKSRPVTAALAGVAMSNETRYPAALDIAGYNYTESMYAADHERYPNRVIYGSENRHSFDAWKAVAANDYIFGQFLWTGVDYLGESRYWPSRGSTAGLIDMAGFVKPRGYFRQSLWSDEPMIYTGTYPAPPQEARQGRAPAQQPPAPQLSTDASPLWNYDDEGILIRVVCYTNASKAKLELNGRVVGETKDYDPNTGIIYWDVPYQQGILTAIALDGNGNEIARNRIQTSGKPSALVLEKVERFGNIIHLSIRAIDDRRTPVVICDDNVTCTVTGSGRLLGLESGNLSDISHGPGNMRRLNSGRLVAYILAEDGEIPLKVSFTSPWLRKVEYQLE